MNGEACWASRGAGLGIDGTEVAEAFVLVLVDDLMVVYCGICVLGGLGPHFAWFVGW